MTSRSRKNSEAQDAPRPHEVTYRREEKKNEVENGKSNQKENE